MILFETSDSGERVEFSTGSVRDTNKGKPRYDLISTLALRRIAYLMMRGAVKYGERNWEKGQPESRLYESALRHLMEYKLGEDDEDHLSAACFNIMAIIHFEEEKQEKENGKAEKVLSERENGRGSGLQGEICTSKDCLQ